MFENRLTASIIEGNCTGRPDFQLLSGFSIGGERDILRDLGKALGWASCQGEVIDVDRLGTLGVALDWPQTYEEACAPDGLLIKRCLNPAEVALARLYYVRYGKPFSFKQRVDLGEAFARLADCPADLGSVDIRDHSTHRDGARFLLSEVLSRLTTELLNNQSIKLKRLARDLGKIIREIEKERAGEQKNGAD